MSELTKFEREFLYQIAWKLNPMMMARHTKKRYEREARIMREISYLAHTTSKAFLGFADALEGIEE